MDGIVGLGLDAQGAAAECNHVHGAHKAAALVATCVMHELSGPSPNAREWRKKVIQELDEVLGTEERQKTCPWVRQNDKLPVCDAVIDEVLRLHPVSLAAARMLGHTVTLKPEELLPPRAEGGKSSAAGTDGKSKALVLPSGHTVQLFLQALHTDTEYWGPDALEFNPARWETDVGKRAKRMAFFPFLEGQRRCLGINIAKLQLRAWLNVMVRLGGIHHAAQPMKDGVPPPRPALVKREDMFTALENRLPYVLSLGTESDAARQAVRNEPLLQWALDLTKKK